MVFKKETLNCAHKLFYSFCYCYKCDCLDICFKNANIEYELELSYFRKFRSI